MWRRRRQDLRRSVRFPNDDGVVARLANHFVFRRRQITVQLLTAAWDASERTDHLTYLLLVCAPITVAVSVI